MAQVIGRNEDGSYTVRRDDGAEVVTALLPPGLEAPRIAPPLAPTQSSGPTASERAALADFAATDPNPPPAPGAIATPRAPTAVDALLDTVGMGAPRPRSGPPTEFAGFRGDPAVMRADAMSGQWTPGGVNSTPATPTPDAIQTAYSPSPRASLAPSDFVPAPVAVQPETGLAASSVASGAVRTRPAGTPGPNALKLYQEGMAKARSAAETAGAVEQQRVEVELGQKRAEEDDAKIRMEEEQRAQAIRSKAMEEAVEDYRKAVADLSTPSGQIDPGRLFRNMGTVQRVQAGISSFLAGFARTTDPMRIAVEQDIAAQRDALDRKDAAKSANVAGKQNMVALMRQKFGDDDVGRAAINAASATYLRKQAERQIASVTTPLAKAKGEELLGKLQMDEATAISGFQDAAARRRGLELENAQRSLAITAAQKAAAQSPAGGLEGLPEKVRERAVMTPYGTVLALDPKGAERLRESTVSVGTTLDLLRQLQAIRREKGAEVLDRDTVEVAKSLAADLQLSLKESKRTGALDKGSQDVLDKLSGGDPTAFRPGILPVLEKLSRRIEDGYRREVKAYTGKEVGVDARTAGGSGVR